MMSFWNKLRDESYRTANEGNQNTLRSGLMLYDNYNSPVKDRHTLIRHWLSLKANVTRHTKDIHNKTNILWKAWETVVLSKISKVTDFTILYLLLLFDKVSGGNIVLLIPVYDIKNKSIYNKIFIKVYHSLKLN